MRKCQAQHPNPSDYTRRSRLRLCFGPEFDPRRLHQKDPRGKNLEGLFLSRVPDSYRPDPEDIRYTFPPFREDESVLWPVGLGLLVFGVVGIVVMSCWTGIQ